MEKTKHTEPPVSLLGQLFWREFFYFVAYKTPNFDRFLSFCNSLLTISL